MKTPRLMAMVLGATFALGGCADNQPTAPVAEAPAFKQADKAAARAALLTDVPVNGALLDGATPAGSFEGTFTAQRFDIDPETRDLRMIGVLSGTATLVDGNEVPVSRQAFATAVELARGSAQENPAFVSPVASTTCQSAAAAATVSLVTFHQVQAEPCDVLFLDLGPLSLDLLGLTVDLSQVVLDVNAVPGAGNLLGNLLCAVVGLLDGFALLPAITQLLETINNILAGLNPGGAAGASFGAPASSPMAALQSA